MAGLVEQRFSSPRSTVPLLQQFNHGFHEALTSVGRLNRQKERAIEKTLPSTVTLVTQGADSAEIGSGFVVRSTPSQKGRPGEVIIATNRHVIETYYNDTQGAYTLSVITSGAKRGVREESLKQEFGAAEIAYVSKHDLAFVRLSLAEHPEVDMPALRLGYSSLVDVPDTLLSVGAPLGTQDTVTELQASQHALTRVCSEEGCDLYRQISLINSGNSGGAIIDPMFAGRFTRPTVVGMPTLGADGNPTQGYMLPVEVIREEFAAFEKQEQLQRAGTRRLPLAA